MRRRRNDDDEGVSLDSLLDTMTNVVGILVLVLVVSQMGIQEAVDRIAETSAVDPAALESLLDQLETLLVDEKEISKQIEDFNPDEKRKAEISSELNINLINKQIQLKDLQQKNAMIEAKNKENKKTQEEMKDYESKHKKIVTQLNSSMEQLAKLESILDKTPARAMLPPKVVNIPDPRIAPDGIKPMYIFCINNQVYPVENLEAIRKDSRDLAEAVFNSNVRKYVKDPKKGIIPNVFLRDYNRQLAAQTKSLTYFYIKMVNRNNVPYLVFEPRPNKGIPVKVIENKNTSFSKAMAQIDPQKIYLRFYVRTDSFDVYLSMRQAIQRTGLLAGWEPQNKDWVYQTSLGGPLRFGPPPPPPDPNAPKPKPKPPGPKPKVID